MKLQMVRSAIQEDKHVETKAGFADLVTETDKNVEKLLIGKLGAKYPNHKYVNSYEHLKIRLFHLDVVSFTGQ